MTPREVSLAREVGELRAIAYILYCNLHAAADALLKAGEYAAAESARQATRLYDDQSTLRGSDDTH